MTICNFRDVGNKADERNFLAAEITGSETLNSIVTTENLMMICGANLYVSVYKKSTGLRRKNINVPSNANCLACTESLGRLFVAVQNIGLYASDDDGETWFLILDTPVAHVTSNRDGLIVCANFSGSTIYYSIDNGNLFVTSQTSIGSANASTRQALSYLPTSKAFVYLTVGGTINYSGSGNSWTNYNPGIFETTPTTCIEYQGNIYYGDQTGNIYTSSVLGSPVSNISNKRFYSQNLGISTAICSWMHVYKSTLYLTSNAQKSEFFSDIDQVFKPMGAGSIRDTNIPIYQLQEFDGELFGVMGTQLIKTFSR